MEIKFSKILELNSELASIVDQLNVKIKKPFTIKTKVIYDGKGDMLDTFDSVLQQADRLLIQCEKNIILIDDKSNQVISQSLCENFCFVDSLTNGSVKQHLKDSSPLRAFTSIADFNLRINQLLLLDNKNKTHSCVYIYKFDKGKKTKCIGVVQSQLGHKASHNMLLDNLLDGNLAVEVELCQLYSFLGKSNDFYCSKPKFNFTSDEHTIGAVNEIIKSFVQIARKNEAGIINDVDTEFLHDYRVSLRKVRSVLSLFKGVYDGDDTTEFGNLFSKIMRETNRLRDFDVYLRDRESYFSLLPRSMYDGLNKLFDMITHDRKIEQKHVANFLMSDEYHRSIECIEHKFKHSTGIKNGPLAHGAAFIRVCHLIWRRYHKVCKIARGVKSETPNNTVHKLRIQCKKLRYLMEFFVHLFPEDKIGQLVKSLKMLQDNLGRFNDLSVQQTSLQSLLNDHSSRDTCDIKLTDSVEGLITVLQHNQMQERDKVMQNFNKFDSPEILTLFTTLFKNK